MARLSRYLLDVKCLVRVDFDAGQDYWTNGVVLATVARMVAAGQDVRAGVHFLCDGVDPMVLMAALRQAGVRQTETFELSAAAAQPAG